MSIGTSRTSRSLETGFELSLEGFNHIKLFIRKVTRLLNHPMVAETSRTTTTVKNTPVELYCVLTVTGLCVAVPVRSGSVLYNTKVQKSCLVSGEE